MLAIAGKTAGPNGLTIFEDTQLLQKSDFFQIRFFKNFYGQRRALQLNLHNSYSQILLIKQKNKFLKNLLQLNIYVEKKYKILELVDY